jgi:hypothetical protein
VRITISIASLAEAPRAIMSNTRGPSEGSVTFWLTTAPTPAWANEHLAATAADDEDIATPNIPVRLHRATIEKVIVFNPE